MLKLSDIPAAYRWLITLAFAGIIILLSLTPDYSRPEDSVFAWIIFNTATVIQKLMHVLMYGILAFLLHWSTNSRTSRNRRVVLTLFLTIGLGIALEWFQTKVPGRFGSLADIILNAVGAIVGTLVALALL